MYECHVSVGMKFVRWVGCDISRQSRRSLVQHVSHACWWELEDWCLSSTIIVGLAVGDQSYDTPRGGLQHIDL